MTVTIDPVTITTLVALILASLGGFVWFGKLSSRVDRLESDVGELKQGQKEILDQIHKQGTELRELINQQQQETMAQLHKQETELRELINQQQQETMAQSHKQGTELRELINQQQQETMALLNLHVGYHQGMAAETLMPTPPAQTH